MEPDPVVAGVVQRVAEVLSGLVGLTDDQRIQVINAVKRELHALSPMKNEPTDCVVWVKASCVVANDYNPNRVAPPEMRLLTRSIEADGYTQPIVTHEVGGVYEVVDGFHRFKVGTEVDVVRERIQGYLPVTVINPERDSKANCIAATIRHNRARGKHLVQEMSSIVLELARRNWSDAKIGRELGMEQDEVLRLKQITGLADLFADKEFSEAWDEGTSSDTSP